ncbi:MAG: radical SAM protein [Deltaproteobacteria bacterium]|nr:radical SAM protein [Deltaproteobacteria bacterium]
MGRLRWLELVADYRCNNRCLGCFSVSDTLPGMDSREAFATMKAGRLEGATGLWMGGGDPTLRRDLFDLLRAARKLGYRDLKLQTNGMLFAYPEFTERALAAGLTEVSLHLMDSEAALHDELAATEGCFDHLLKGLRELRARDVPVEGDILVYQRNLHRIPEIVRFFHGEGVHRFKLWLFSAVDQGGEDLSGEVPRIEEVVARLVEALDLGLSDDPAFITSYHTPPCTVPASHHRALFYPPELGLMVACPGGDRFLLETSPMEGGAFLDTCAGCSLRPRCGGPRADYLRIHGGEIFRPPPPPASRP